MRKFKIFNNMHLHSNGSVKQYMILQLAMQLQNLKLWTYTVILISHVAYQTFSLSFNIFFRVLVVNQFNEHLNKRSKSSQQQRLFPLSLRMRASPLPQYGSQKLLNLSKPKTRFKIQKKSEETIYTLALFNEFTINATIVTVVNYPR